MRGEGKAISSLEERLDADVDGLALRDAVAAAGLRMPLGLQSEATDLLEALLRRLRGSVLTREEEQALARRIEAGDAAARTALIHHNLRLLVSVVRRCQVHGLSLADLIQEGYFGLSRAVDKSDRRRGTTFSTYATFWIRETCLRALAAKGSASRVPEHVRSWGSMLRRAASELTVRLSRTPSRVELAAATAIAGAHTMLRCRRRA